MNDEKAKRKAVAAIQIIIEAAKELAAADESYRKSKNRRERRICNQTKT